VSPGATEVIKDAWSMRVKGLFVWAVGAAMVATAVASCSGDDSSSTSGSTAATTSTGTTITLTQPSEPLTVKIAQLRGGVKRKDFGKVKHGIAKPIAAWVDGGFLDPQYPATDFGDAFGSWTEGAGLLAQRDRDVTTNAELGPKLIAIVADSQTAKLYVFANDGRTGGATAKVKLRFTGEMSDQSLVHFVVQGDLYLTRKDSQWQIFGYRLDREDVA
jgi:hypothetical protein